MTQPAPHDAEERPPAGSAPHLFRSEIGRRLETVKDDFLEAFERTFNTRHERGPLRQVGPAPPRHLSAVEVLAIAARVLDEDPRDLATQIATRALYTLSMCTSAESVNGERYPTPADKMAAFAIEAVTSKAFGPRSRQVATAGLTVLGYLNRLEFLDGTPTSQSSQGRELDRALAQAERRRISHHELARWIRANTTETEGATALRPPEKVFIFIGRPTSALPPGERGHIRAVVQSIGRALAELPRHLGVGWVGRPQDPTSKQWRDAGYGDQEPDMWTRDSDVLRDCDGYIGIAGHVSLGTPITLDWALHAQLPSLLLYDKDAPRSQLPEAAPTWLLRIDNWKIREDIPIAVYQFLRRYSRLLGDGERRRLNQDILHLRSWTAVRWEWDNLSAADKRRVLELTHADEREITVALKSVQQFRSSALARNVAAVLVDDGTTRPRRAVMRQMGRTLAPEARRALTQVARKQGWDDARVRLLTHEHLTASPQRAALHAGDPEYWLQLDRRVRSTR